MLDLIFAPTLTFGGREVAVDSTTIVVCVTSAIEPEKRDVEARWELEVENETVTGVGFPLNVGFVGFSVVDFCKLGTDTLPFTK